jgi:hypothetical protein
MVLHEGGDEIIAVIVTGLHPQRQVNTGGAACLRQQVGAQLLFEEVVSAALIDKQFRQARPILDKCDRIPGAPDTGIGTQIAAQRSRRR